MTRAEFIMLPAPMALAALYDCLDPDTVDALKKYEAPKVPRQPRFDYALYGSSGISFASECDLAQLDWHMARAQKSVADGGQWAERDKKKLEKLKEWRIWRLLNPSALWVGKRGDEENTIAAPPSNRPRQYPRPNNGGSSREQQNDEGDFA